MIILPLVVDKASPKRAITWFREIYTLMNPVVALDVSYLMPLDKSKTYIGYAGIDFFQG